MMGGNSGPKVPIQPMVDWLDAIYQERRIAAGVKWDKSRSTSGGNQLSTMDLAWADGNIRGLAEAVGMSVRRFSDSFVIVAGHVTAKAAVETIGIYTVDGMLSHYGAESLPEVYSWDEQPETTVAKDVSRCRKCFIELRSRAGGICGFCMEEGN